MIPNRCLILLEQIGFLSNKDHANAVKSRYKNVVENEFQ